MTRTDEQCVHHKLHTYTHAHIHVYTLTHKHTCTQHSIPSWRRSQCKQLVALATLLIFVVTHVRRLLNIQAQPAVEMLHTGQSHSSLDLYRLLLFTMNTVYVDSKNVLPTLTRTHTCVHKRTLAHLRGHTDVTHTRTHTHSHTHTHTHTHTQPAHRVNRASRQQGYVENNCCAEIHSISLRLNELSVAPSPPLPAGTPSTAKQPSSSENNSQVSQVDTSLQSN